MCLLKISKIEILVSLNLMNNSQCNFEIQDCLIPVSVEFLFVALNCKLNSLDYLCGCPYIVTLHLIIIFYIKQEIIQARFLLYLVNFTV